MKQSILSFSSPQNGVSSLKASSSANAIVIDDSEEDEDGIATPPPPLQVARAGNSIIVEIPIASSSETSTANPQASEKAKADSKETSKSSKKKDTFKNSTTKKEANAANQAPAKDSILCHHHRSACHVQIRCTIRKENGRCKMRYCCSSLQRVYKQDPEQILKAGRNVLGAELREHVESNEANFIWKVSLAFLLLLF